MSARNDPVIDQEIRDILRKHTPQEEEELEQNIIRDGNIITDPLIIWKETKILLDGHCRLRISKKLKIIAPAELISIPNREATIEWVITHQLGRRNNTPEENSLLRGSLYNRRKSHPGGIQDGRENVAESVAKETGVSVNTVYSDARFDSAVSAVSQSAPEARDLARDGKIGKSAAEELATMTPAKQRKVVKAVSGGASARKAIDDAKPDDQPCDATGHPIPGHLKTELVDAPEAAKKALQAMKTVMEFINTFKDTDVNRPGKDTGGTGWLRPQLHGLCQTITSMIKENIGYAVCRECNGTKRGLKGESVCPWCHGWGVVLKHRWDKYVLAHPEKAQ